MNTQNKFILEKFREKYVINHPPTPPYITDEFEVDSIESFILSALQEQRNNILNVLHNSQMTIIRLQPGKEEITIGVSELLF